MTGWRVIVIVSARGWYNIIIDASYPHLQQAIQVSKAQNYTQWCRRLCLAPGLWCDNHAKQQAP